MTRYITDILSTDQFFTDSNGRRWVERVRYVKKYFNDKTQRDDIIARNYYPITTAAKILDDQNQLTVIVDRPEGVTSMKSGELEIMVRTCELPPPLPRSDSRSN